MAAVGAGVGAVVTVVAGVGTGATVVEQPAERMPTNKTAQTKNNKDFISQNIVIFY
jgi:serine acetyltransferase